MTGIKHLFTYGLAFGDAWLYALVILASAIYSVGVLKRQQGTSLIRFRVLSGIGILTTAAGIFLGGIWPSYYTLVAILIHSSRFSEGRVARSSPLFDLSGNAITCIPTCSPCTAIFECKMGG